MMQNYSAKLFIISAFVKLLCCNSSVGASPQSESIIAYALTATVKSYPPKIQEIDALYEAKCLQCHGTKETARSPGVLPSYWEQTVEKMRAMPKANFSQEEGAQISKLLIYDSFYRRRIDLKNQLKALPEAQLKIESEKLDSVINQFKE
jgi:hypothetical protein